MQWQNNLPPLFVSGYLAYAGRHAGRLAALERASLDEITAVIERARRPYVALSGGKDSMLLLWLCRQILPGIECVWVDEWDVRATWDILDYVEHQWGNRVWRVRHKIHPEFYRRYGVQPVLNQPVRIDYHLERYGDLPPLGFDAAFVGMRRDESKNRDRVLRQQQTQYLRTRLILRSAPLANWRLDDAWAYTISRGLPVHHGYARQIAAGVPLKHARVGGLTVIRLLALGVGYKHKMVDRNDWSACVAANPCMARDN